MAIIGKIRERSGLLIVLVGGAMVAFILSDLFTNRGPSAEDQVIGEVGGDPILLQKFERRVNDEVESYRNDFGQQVDGAMQEQIRQRVWNEMVRDRVYGPHVREAGLAVVKDEYDDIRFGDNILPEFRNQPNFQDPQTGEPDRQALRQYFEAVQLNAPVYHAIQRDRLVDQRLYNKYETLVQRSIFANSAQAREEFASRNAKVTFDFVAKRYDSEPDSLYPVSENDLEKYYNAHKNDPRHQQKASRGFSYVTFPVTPTLADREALRDELAGLKADFEAAENDSLFVVGNSDTRVYSVMPYVAGTADAATDTLLLNAAVGTVVGPYQQGETWKLSKVVELAKVEEARVRHILLSTQGKDQLAIDGISARADSLLRVVKRDRSKFEELVTEFSEDPGSVQNGGVYEWFDRGRMVPEFTIASFDEPVGAITIARTSYGFHIVEVLGQRERDERRIASIDRQMRPSPGTFNTMYKEANDFSLRFTSPEAFKSGAEE
ncbi:MAG: SurA N-terminal domain-containing protein, partial [Flavobacteriales bacterium]|nr:SurA N-terminal domain-containing protein [Flavobacteriales bacterium]